MKMLKKISVNIEENAYKTLTMFYTLFWETLGKC